MFKTLWDAFIRSGGCFIRFWRDVLHLNPPQPRGADLFESYVGSIIASCSLAMMPMDELEEGEKLVLDYKDMESRPIAARLLQRTASRPRSLAFPADSKSRMIASLPTRGRSLFWTRRALSPVLSRQESSSERPRALAAWHSLQIPRVTWSLRFARAPCVGLVLPILLAAVGIFCSAAGVFAVSTKEEGPAPTSGISVGGKTEAGRYRKGAK